MTQVLDGLRQIAGVDGGGVVRQIATDTSGAVKLAADVTVDIGEVQILGADGATVLSVVAAEGDGIANTLGAVRANAHGYLWNGATWDRQKSDGVTGAAAVGGSVADATADSGNPVKVGAVVTAGLGADLTAANRTNLYAAKRGGLLVSLSDPATANLAKALAPSDAVGTGSVGLFTNAFASIFNGSTWDRLRGANIFKNVDGVAVTAGTPATVWTPAAGKKFRILGWSLSLSVAGAIILWDNTGKSLEAFRLPAMPIGQGTVAPELDNGYLSAAANNVLQIDCTASGTIHGHIFGVEE